MTDCITLVNEVVEEIIRKRNPSLIFKVDFEKAFDCLNGEYLDNMMVNLGFNQTWRRWITECSSLASVSVLINGINRKSVDLTLFPGVVAGNAGVSVSHVQYTDDDTIILLKTATNMLG